jgi:LysM repeat protein
MNVSQSDSLSSGFQTPLPMDDRIAQAMPQSPQINMGGVRSDPSPGEPQEDNSGTSSTLSNGVRGPDGVVRDGNGDPVRASGAGNADAVIRSVLGGSGNDPTLGSNGSGTGTTATPNPSGTSATTPTGATPTGTATTTSTPAATLQGRDPDLIYAGEKIKLPDGNTYTVKDGDTLSSIAKAHGVSLESLIKLNGFNDQLLDEYKDGRLVKAHRVGDPMPTTPGGVVLGTPQTPQIPPAGTVTDPGKPGFPAKDLSQKLDSLIKPIGNRDEIKQILDKIAAHQADAGNPDITPAERAKLDEFMKDYGNALLQPMPPSVSKPEEPSSPVKEPEVTTPEPPKSPFTPPSKDPSVA